MKRLVFLVSLFFLTCWLYCQDDPLKVESYQLSNGLTVYLNEDHNMPMVHGMVAVKGGAKRDPGDATGIAHYFEHIMFKGTDEIGTIGYEQEKPYLDSIKNLYDELLKKSSEEERAIIRKEINRISLKAADYAIPNEFDKIVSTMGGTGLNAGTGQEMIVYYNSFPANQIAKWIELYSHRFIHPVYRLFQSELETVYEEKNMSLDDPMERMFEKYLSSFYKKSPYGQQTVLGSVEHLKNPSLSKMEEYFNTYYVARNMALVLAGDFYTDSVKPIIEEKFGRWRSGEIPPQLNLKEEPFRGRELVSVRMTPIKIGIMGFRTIPRNHEDEMELEVIANLLTNQSSTGLIDELVNDNKIMMAMAFSDLKTELGGYLIAFVPKVVGQSLEDAEKLVKGQLHKLMEGAFSDNLLRGVKTGLKKQYEANLEDMRWRTYAIMDAFIYGVSWEKYLSAPAEIEQITRKDIISIANKYLGDNYLVFFSKTGFPIKTKLDKPPYDPVVAKNADRQSAYACRIEEMPVTQLEPRFIDFGKDVLRTDLSEGVTAFLTQNPINQIFSIRIKYGKGSYDDPLVDQATGIFQYAHPEGQSYMDFKSELQLLGCDIYAYNDLSSTTVSIDGLEENLEPSLQLVNKLLTGYSIDEKQLEKLVQDIKFEKKFEKKDLWTKNDALGKFAIFGQESDYLSRLSEDEIKKLTTGDLVSKFREITGFENEVHYCGTRDTGAFNKIYTEYMTIPGELTVSPGRIELEREDYESNTIIFLDDKKAIQSHINIYVDGEVNDEKSRTDMAGFNEYVGGTMASILFQEIREFRSLAYGVRGGYRSSFYFDRPGYFAGFLSTQSDKTLEALEAYRNILTILPEKPERMEAIRSQLTLSVNASQPAFRDKSATVSDWLQQGYQEDPRRLRYQEYGNMEFPAILGFYKDNLAGKPWLVTIVGDSRRMNLEKLTDYGKVKTVTFKDVYKW